MKPLRLDDAARDELLHEVRFLEAARRGSGRKFREAVAQAFERIRRNPHVGARTTRVVGGCGSAAFAFQLFFVSIP